MWICKKCNTENEDSFDSCWKCQAFSEQGSVRSFKYQKKVEKQDKEQKEKKEFEKKVGDKLENKRFQIWIVAAISFVLLVFLGVFLDLTTDNRIIVGGAFCSAGVIRQLHKNYLERKIIEELEKEK